MPRLDFLPKLPSGFLRVRLGWLLALGALQTGLYAGLADLSHRFSEENAPQSAPRIEVLALLGTAFLLYLISLIVAARSERIDTDLANRTAYARWCSVLVLGMALVFRFVLWPSHPIQEIDIYRYLWDGHVAAEGVAPYRYTPADVDRYGSVPDAPRDLRRLADLRDRSTALQTIFARVHHRDVPSIYPPLSQTVFALAALLTPDQAPVSLHIGIFKGLILAFDLLTVVFVLALLKELGRPGWLLIIYAWCPLILKEFANSGHLDSVAICLLTITLYLMLRPANPDQKGTDITGETESRAFITGLLFGAATLAKLFPLVLLPLFVRWWWQRLRWRCLFPLAGLLLVLGTVYGPLLFTHYSQDPLTAQRSANELKPRPDPRNPLEGLAVFLTRWESNDFLFAFVHQNVRTHVAPNEEAWFAWAPLSLRHRLLGASESLLDRLGVSSTPETSAMILARIIVGSIFMIIVLWLALRPWPGEQRHEFGRSIFLSLAWLWFLSPAQNPWCWCWAMPFIFFASRPWLLVSGAALLYYLRFWLIYSYDNPSISGSWSGARFFDEVIVPLEHLPVLLLILAGVVFHKWHGESQKRNKHATVS